MNHEIDGEKFLTMLQTTAFLGLSPRILYRDSNVGQPIWLYSASSMSPGSGWHRAASGKAPTDPLAPISDGLSAEGLPGDGTVDPRLLEISQPPTVGFQCIPSPSGVSFAPAPYLSGAQFPSDIVEPDYPTPLHTAMDYGQYTQPMLQAPTFEFSAQRLAQDS